ncbi:MAG: antibiotic biosynthesis monooxygenase [Candidatus Riflebacteria bacterium]|nr:antibiotic biosynthesis monooxygenase [Candidatus Riflebacteria bacterium]
MSRFFKYSIFFVVCFSLVIGLIGCSILGNDDDDDVIYTPTPVMVLSRWIVKPGQEEAARAAALEFVQETRKEAGVLSYDLYSEVLLDGVVPATQTYWFREVFKDFAAIETHTHLPHFYTMMGLAATTYNAPLEAIDEKGVATTTPTFFDVTVQDQNTYAVAISNPGVIKISYLKTTAGLSDDARNLLSTLMTATRAESGCYGFDLYSGFNNPDDGFVGTPPEVFHTFQQWKDEAAYTAHIQTPSYVTAKAKLPAGIKEAVSTVSRVGVPDNSIRSNFLTTGAQTTFVPQPVNERIMANYIKAMNGQ